MVNPEIMLSDSSDSRPGHFSSPFLGRTEPPLTGFCSVAGDPTSREEQ